MTTVFFWEVLVASEIDAFGQFVLTCFAQLASLMRDTCSCDSLPFRVAVAQKSMRKLLHYMQACSEEIDSKEKLPRHVDCIISQSRFETGNPYALSVFSPSRFSVFCHFLKAGSIRAMP